MTGNIGDTLALPPTPLPPALPPPSRWLLDAFTAAAHWCTARPWIGIVAAAAVAAASTAHTVAADQRHRRLSRSARLITVIPPPQVDPAGAATFWGTLGEVLHPTQRRGRHGGSHAAGEYRGTGRPPPP